MSTELTDEQLKELEGLYQSIERKKVDPNEDFAVTDEEYRKFVTFWSSLHNTFPALLSTIQSLRTERDSLQAWKDSAMQVEREWNAQKVGKLLKLPFGSSIKAGIEPAIVELIDERASLRTELAAAKEREQGLREENAKLIKLLQEAFDKATESACEAIERIGDYGTQSKVAAIEDAAFVTWKAFKQAALSQPPQSPWRDIAEAPKGQKLVAGYWNQLGNWRSVMACYYPPKTLPATDDYMADDEWAPEGWYEESETHEELHKLDCPPVLWQPLPQPPTKGGEV